MSKHRLFLALDIDESARDALSEAMDVLDEFTDRGVRWTATENLHVTLKFIGETAGGDIPGIIESVSGTLWNVRPFAFDICGLLGLPPTGNVLKMIWADIKEPTGTLASLATALEESMTSVGVTPEHRPFLPHVTLARVKYLQKIEPFRKRLSAFSLRMFGRVDVSRVTLYESELFPSGPVYSPMSHFELSPQGDWNS